MKHWLMLSTTGLMLLLGSGCTLGDKASETFNAVATEISQAVDNVTTTVSDMRSWVETKISQVKETTEDVQEAAESVDEAVNSVQELTGLGAEEEKETPAESSDSTTEQES